LEVAFGGRREARLDDVDAEMLELACDRELLLDVHGGARRLLAVAERGVEDPYPVHRRSPLCQPGRENTWGHEPPGPWPQKTKTPRGGRSRPWRLLESSGFSSPTPLRGPRAGH